MVYHENIGQKKAEVAVLMLGNGHFGTQTTNRDKKTTWYDIKGSVYSFIKILQRNRMNDFILKGEGGREGRKKGIMWGWL